MANSNDTTTKAARNGNPPAANGHPTEVTELMANVRELLDSGQAAQALNALGRAKLPSAWMTNATGVCQLRLGNAEAALGLFRTLAVAPGGLLLRHDVPTVFLTNYAAALMASGNPAGCLAALAEVEDQDQPAVTRLRDCVRRWRDGLPLWQRLNWWLGGHPARPVVPDFPLGDLE